MTLERAKSIDDLYDEVADYDLVLTADAPLSLALNRRLEHPRLGRFATTPQMLATGDLWPKDSRRLFLALVAETDLDWKHAAHLVTLVLNCWDETGDLEAILEYDRFDTPATRSALSVIERTDSAHRELDRYEPAEDQAVAVIDPDSFTAQDRQGLPAAYDPITPFENAEFELPNFHIYDSATAIVDTVVKSVDEQTAERVAVVMDRGSHYPDLVESGLAAADIPFHGGPGFADDDGVRTVLRLLRVALRPDAATVGDVRPILSRTGRTVPESHDNKRLSAVDHPELVPLQKFCASVDGRTFGEVVTEVAEWTDRSLTGLADELRELGIHDEPITTDGLDDLEFYLQAFEVPITRENEGVLLADPTTAAYVDRPVVFYLGMDADWTQRIRDWPWIDAEAADRRALRQFQILLQNGQRQYFLVQETSDGTSVTPCLYFHELLERDCEEFTDLPHERHTHRFTAEEAGFDHASVPAPPEAVTTVSQSGLNTFVNCPRDYFFDQVVPSPDRDYFRKGTLFHDYAEAYVNDPDAIRATDREAIIDFFVSELRPFVDDVDLGMLHTEFTIGTRLLERFLDESPPVVRDYDGYTEMYGDNAVAEFLDIDIDSPVTERYFENRRLGGHGVVDLIQAPDRLVDYKSGSADSETKVVSKSNVGEIHDEPDFQALMYLAHHRDVHPGEELSFVFFHFLDLVDDELTDRATLEDAYVRVTYHPETFAEFAARRPAFDNLIDGVSESNNRRKTLERMGYERYEAFFGQHAFPAVEDRDVLLDTEFADRFTEHAVDLVGDYKYVQSGTDSALKKLHRYRDRNYFKEDVEAFEAFLGDQLDTLNEYRRGTFPVGDPNIDRLNNRDLIRR